jgi:diaminohydroxyphosphoribosylaminopyrimidine deaminase/5-amino-6-(5-phosphoribosylamino)uracil reductase
VVIAATDPNPEHAGRAFDILRRSGIKVAEGALASEATRLNEPFNHWITHRTPFVTVKAAMSLDGKIATSAGQSKWITGTESRAYAMHLRQGSDAILVGINTVLADDPALTVRAGKSQIPKTKSQTDSKVQPLRVVLDSQARTPLTSKLVTDEHASRTVIVAASSAPGKRIAALQNRVKVWVDTGGGARKASQGSEHCGINLSWLLARLGGENITSLLVEGGGEVNASFLFGGFAHRIAFFYAPKIIGGRDARKGVAGDGISDLKDALNLAQIEWRTLGPDLLLTGLVIAPMASDDDQKPSIAAKSP